MITSVDTIAAATAALPTVAANPEQPATAPAPERRAPASLVGRWSSRQKPILISGWTGVVGRR